MYCEMGCIRYVQRSLFCPFGKCRTSAGPEIGVNEVEDKILNAEDRKA